jgi:hypothetical protein
VVNRLHDVRLPRRLWPPPGSFQGERRPYILIQIKVLAPIIRLIFCRRCFISSNSCSVLNEKLVSLLRAVWWVLWLLGLAFCNEMKWSSIFQHSTGVLPTLNTRQSNMTSRYVQWCVRNPVCLISWLVVLRIVDGRSPARNIIYWRSGSLNCWRRSSERGI